MGGGFSLAPWSGGTAGGASGAGAGADAALAASVFHYGTYTVGDLKKFLAEKKVPVRV
mgnify:CR=1 FL=1